MEWHLQRIISLKRTLVLRNDFIMPEHSATERTIISAINSFCANPTLEPGPGRRSISAKAAVRRCCKAWQRVFDRELKKALEQARMEEELDCDEDSDGDLENRYERIFAAQEASRAYRNAMPLLAGSEGVRNFVACVAHGILIGAINKEQSGPLLYAAQVALGSIQREARSMKSTIAAALTPPPSPRQAVIASESAVSN